jgi:hypothetical protein
MVEDGASDPPQPQETRQSINQMEDGENERADKSDVDPFDDHFLSMEDGNEHDSQSNYAPPRLDPTPQHDFQLWDIDVLETTSGEDATLLDHIKSISSGMIKFGATSVIMPMVLMG